MYSNETIKEVSDNIEGFSYNLATIRIRTLFDNVSAQKIDKKTTEIFLKLLHPFCPHITEELWSNLGNKTFLSLEKWPKADEKKINPEFEKEEKLVEDTINDALNIINIVKGKGSNVKTNCHDLINKCRDFSFSIDAEGGLRDKLSEKYGDDLLNMNKVREYIQSASSVLR